MVMLYEGTTAVTQSEGSYCNSLNQSPVEMLGSKPVMDSFVVLIQRAKPGTIQQSKRCL